MTKRLILSIFILTFFYGAGLAEEVIIGSAHVKDGDSLIIEGQRIRLEGIDAPEWNQPCELDNGSKFYPSREAKAWLQSLIKNQDISCNVHGLPDRYKRKIATCYLQELNINKALVQEGFVFVNEFFVNDLFSDDYLGYAKEAKADKKGLWRGTCEEPWVWRKKNPR